MKNLKNKIAIITGANAGLGYETALQLTLRGATVISACRNKQKAGTSRESILKKFPAASVEVMQIDTSSLASVKNFAQEFLNRYNRLDILISVCL